MAGRPSRLKDPEFAKAVAEAYISGMGRDEMCEVLQCSKDSISTWVRDPRVQAHASRLTLDRIQRITRRIDSEVEGRLAHVGNWKIEDLLKVRKEYLERSLKVAEASAGTLSETSEELAEAMDQDADLATELRRLVGAA